MSQCYYRSGSLTHSSTSSAQNITYTATQLFHSIFFVCFYGKYKVTVNIARWISHMFQCNMEISCVSTCAVSFIDLWLNLFFIHKRWRYLVVAARASVDFPLLVRKWTTTDLFFQRTERTVTVASALPWAMNIRQLPTFNSLCIIHSHLLHV